MYSEDLRKTEDIHILSVGIALGLHASVYQINMSETHLCIARVMGHKKGQGETIVQRAASY